MPKNDPVNPPRRRFVAQSLTLMAGAVAMPDAPHVCLLGDSIFDNKSYVGGKPDVIAQLGDALPANWKSSLLAVDGATTHDIGSQLRRLPVDASHLVLSIGGNDALRQAGILSAPARTIADALTKLFDVAREFELTYRETIKACLNPGLPLAVCTIYNGHFPDKDYQKQVTVALAVFNDVIIRIAAERGLAVLELRQICNEPEDYANPIEPSSIGGAKIARAIARVVVSGPLVHGAHVIGPQQ